MGWITKRRPAPAAPAPGWFAGLEDRQRRTAHLVAALLLDYPSEEFPARLAAVRAAIADLPAEVRDGFDAFLAAIDAMPAMALERHYVATFDLKRKCCLYLSYYANGDTRRRGAALVGFRNAYRSAGWEFDADELPDFLPAVLEFSARGSAPIASELIAAHRAGIEVLLGALEGLESPYAHVVRALCRTLPELDADTVARTRALVEQGPPAETVGLTFLGNLEPYAPTGASREEVRA